MRKRRARSLRDRFAIDVVLSSGLNVLNCSFENSIAACLQISQSRADRHIDGDANSLGLAAVGVIDPKSRESDLNSTGEMDGCDIPVRAGGLASNNRGVRMRLEHHGVKFCRALCPFVDENRNAAAIERRIGFRGSCTIQAPFDDSR